jgi:hypothetical protein
MKKILLAAAGFALLATACKKQDDVLVNDRNSLAGLAKITTLGVDTIGGVINSGDTVKLWSDTLYKLDAKLYVKSGGVLWIQAGTRIEGIKKIGGANAVGIIVTRGGKIYAMGTAQKPIVMTANTYPNAAPGDWGGVVILGSAICNKVEPTIEGVNLPTLPPGVDVHYGGANDADNSGIFQYVRIEYAGALLTPDNELNALTCGGVGSGTSINHVQAIYGADDGFEFFGGRVNCDHLISFACNDDQFDFDFGFRGRMQFLVGVISETIPGVVGAGSLYSANPNGIECDNDATGSNDAPRTWPVISNMTLVGAKDAATAHNMHLWFGNQWRRNSAFTLRNSVIIGYDTTINLTSAGTIATIPNPQANNNTALTNFRAVYTIAFTKGITNAATNTSANKLYISPDGNLRDPLVNNSKMLINPYPLDPNALSSGLEPKWSSLLTGANFSNTVGFQAVPFKGAVGQFANNWLYESWVDFTP